MTQLLLQHCSICLLQAKVVGAVEVPLFVTDDDMSPAGLLKQVGSDGCTSTRGPAAAGLPGRLAAKTAARRLPLQVLLSAAAHRLNQPCISPPRFAVGLQLWHGRLVAGRLAHEAQPRFPERGAGEEQTFMFDLVHKAPDLPICTSLTPGSASDLLRSHL